MTLIRLGLVPFLTLVLVACGDDGGGTDTSTGDTSTGDTSTGDTSTGDTSTGDTGTGGDAGDTGTDGGGGTACITHLDPACTDTEYCDFPDNLCGMGEAGVCTARPATCTDEIASACHCNGLVYSNGCSGMMGGFDLDNNGACTPPAETFTCGSRVCRAGMEYCQVQVSDIGGEPDVYDCQALPAGCMGSDVCTCFEPVPCGGMCAVDGGNFTVTCPGG